nr:MAG TPA: Cytochrome b [Caudoviricetes sp.]
MILKRVGVFETNSSSCHSMAYVGRLQKKTPRNATITDIYGELGYTPMFDDDLIIDISSIEVNADY